MSINVFIIIIIVVIRLMFHTDEINSDVSSSTVKPLYSEQSRDPKQCSLYGGVHPRGRRYVHAHMCLKYNLHILKLTSQISLTFESLISLYFSSKFKFFRFADMLTKTD